MGREERRPPGHSSNGHRRPSRALRTTRLSARTLDPFSPRLSVKREIRVDILVARPYRTPDRTSVRKDSPGCFGGRDAVGETSREAFEPRDARPVPYRRTQHARRTRPGIRPRSLRRPAKTPTSSLSEPAVSAVLRRPTTVLVDGRTRPSNRSYGSRDDGPSRMSNGGLPLVGGPPFTFWKSVRGRRADRVVGRDGGTPRCRRGVDCFHFTPASVCPRRVSILPLRLLLTTPLWGVVG